MRIPNLLEYQEQLKTNNNLINVLHQKNIDDNVIDLVLTFNKPDDGFIQGEVQNIENLTNDLEINTNDLDEDDLEKIQLLFKAAAMGDSAITNGLSIEDFPEFEKEGIDDILLGTNVEDYNPNELAVGKEVEREHTNYVQAATDIAKHHLSEDPEYYTKLLKTGLVDEETAIQLAHALKMIDDNDIANLKQNIRDSGVKTKIFITDLGISHMVKSSDGDDFAIPRYGVWSTKSSKKPNVIETSDNLDMLLEKYKLSDNDVIKLMKN